MKAVFLIVIFSFLMSFPIHGQMPFGKKGPTLKGKIEGIVIDSLTRTPVGFATISIYKAGSTIVQDGLISDEDGKFKFDVVTGKYDIVISFLGYDEEKIAGVETTLKSPDFSLGDILLSPSAVLLEAVEIKEDKALFENKADKLVFNAENDATIAGGDAADVLRKVPLLAVDLNGNVSLRGSQNVRILINGKPSGMFSSNVADALKMFPADQIKQVEVITSPSAKYDAEGSAGIINIITKKENIEGMAGSVNASIGNRQNSLFLNFNAGKGRLGVSSSAAVFYSTPANGIATFERFDNTALGQRSITQTGDQRTSRLGGNGSVSAFYDFNGYNSINSSLNFRGFGFNIDGTIDGNIVDPSQNFTDNFLRYNKNDNLFGGFDWNTDYTRKFEKHEGRELTFAVQYSNQINNQDSHIEETHDNLTLLNRNTDIVNEGDNYETTLQVDYTHPFTKSLKLETGAKSVLRKIISTYDTDLFSLEGYKNVHEKFDYNQNVLAGYASINYLFAKNYNIIAGLRYEGTDYRGSFESNDQLDFSNKYNNVLPSLIVSRSFKNFRTLKLSYTERIQRPSLQFINPFVNNADFVNRTVGNPYLAPENVKQVDLSYNITFAGITTFSSVFYKYTDNIIEQILSIDINGLSVNSFNNIGTNKSVGFNTFMSKSVGLMTLRTGGNIATYDANGIVNGLPASRKSYEYNLFLNGELKFSGTLKMDFFGFFRSPVRTIQGDNPKFTIFGTGFRKEFKNSSIGITLIEPFEPNKYFRSDIKGPIDESTGDPTFTQKTSFSIPFRSIGVNFRYKFGNVDFKERKSKVKNTDLKQGSDNSGGQGGTTPMNNN